VFFAREPALDLLRIHGAARPLAAQAILAGGILFSLSGLANTTAAALQAWDRFDLANVVNLTTSLGQVAGITLVLARGGGLVACLGAVIAGWLLAFLVGVLLLARGVPRFRWGSLAGAREKIREAVAFGLPLQAANAVAVGHQMLGKVLLVRLVALASVVPYELGLRVSSAGFTFAQLALVAMLPEASALHTRAESERLQSLHVRAGRFVTAVAAVLTAAMVASATPLFMAWLGHEDAKATLALRGLAIASYAAVVGGVTGAIGRGVAKIGIELEWTMLAFLIHLGLGVWLVPRMGLAGALIALAAANFIAALYFVTRLRRSLGWPVGRLLWEPFAVPVVAMALGAWLGAQIAHAIHSPWVALGASAMVALVVTFGVLLAFRHVEWREIVSLVRRAAAA
jgi:O-antigen/teichoic acid export membrane protein